MYHVSHQGQQFGPYTVEQINEYLAQGAFDANSHVWDANANGWIEIWQLPGVVLPQKHPVTKKPQETESPAEILIAGVDSGGQETAARDTYEREEKQGEASTNLSTGCVGILICGGYTWYVFNKGGIFVIDYTLICFLVSTGLILKGLYGVVRYNKWKK